MKLNLEILRKTKIKAIEHMCEVMNLKFELRKDFMGDIYVFGDDEFSTFDANDAFDYALARSFVKGYVNT